VKKTVNQKVETPIRLNIDSTVVDDILRDIFEEFWQVISVKIADSSQTSGTDQDSSSYPKIEVLDILENDSNPEIFPKQNMFFDDESASCKSHVLPSTSSLKIESVKSVKRKLNTNAKVFTRSTDKEASLNESVYSVNEPPLSNFITKPNEFNSPQMVSSISQQDHQNHDFPLTAESKHLGSMYVKNTGADFKLGSKSVQHTQCENSPIKDEGFLKNKFSKNFKEFTPTYLKKGYSDHHQYNSQSMPVAPNFQANPKFNNTMEMNCFQMLQERLAAFTTNRFPPAYDQVSGCG